MASQVKRYPWEDWFSQDEFRLKRGKDFQCMPHGMIVQIRTYAASRRIKVAIKVVSNDTIQVTVKERGNKRNAG
jgi:hypothetical protein